MIPNPARRVMHQGYEPFHAAPNAALLIDFDNVTMGIRSDLGKELKALLNSDVIRGKVAVQRAYADWRRYPQYIVPLAESSIDLIFAPAYGSAKKNATDLRMAIDAMELVFTRPEIGTFILLTGDSDFSSCVLKLKEYGKYVIGVGMRESSSDLLIQNCDEYYSYHSLSGLTRAGDEDKTPGEDPWELVQRAAERMASNNDTMRADRLKQVMLDLDPRFDEKQLGYSKFSRFVTEAAGKGLIRLKKGQNGQYEIMLNGDSPAPAPAGRTTSRSTTSRTRTSSAEPQPVAKAAAAPALIQPAVLADDINAAYALLQTAIRELGGSEESGVRDGDVKRKMLDINPSFDEANHGFPKFSRFLRQAHDDEMVDLDRSDTQHYEVKVGGKAAKAPAGAAAAAPATGAAAAPVAEEEAAGTEPATAAASPRGRTPSRGRGRRGGGTAEGPPPLLPGQVVSAGAPAAAEPAQEKAAPAKRAAKKARADSEPQEETAAGETKKPSRSRRGRRKPKGTPADGPPELLPGQIVGAVSAADAEEPAAPAEEKKPAAKRSRARKAPVRGKTAAATAFDAASLNLPQDDDAIRSYLTNSYKGIGAKTADSLLSEFGSDVFLALQEQPHRVREVMGAKRADSLIEQWASDYQRRATSGDASAPASSGSSADVGADEPEEDGGTASRPSRSRSRGGRSRGSRTRKKPAAE